MSATISVPQLFRDLESPRRLQVHQPGEPERPPLPRVKWKTSHGPILHASPFGAPGEMLSLNLIARSSHRGVAPYYPGDHLVYLYGDISKRLEEELRSRSRLPRAIYISPSTDPFPPLADVQEETARVVAVAARHGVDACLMTRGFIRPAILRTLAAHADRVRVTMGLTTLNRALQRALEPLAAPPRMRLRQMARLKSLGIPVQAALEPLIPGLTDTRQNLVGVLEGLAAIGVRQVTAGYLFLRPGIQDSLIGVLRANGWDDSVLAAFEEGPILKADSQAAARYLPRTRRQRGYASLMALAAEFGITVRISRLANPDFRFASL